MINKNIQIVSKNAIKKFPFFLNRIYLPSTHKTNFWSEKHNLNQKLKSEQKNHSMVGVQLKGGPWLRLVRIPPPVQIQKKSISLDLSKKKWSIVRGGVSWHPLKKRKFQNQMPLKSLANWWSCPPLRGRPATCRPPPGCSSPREGHWGGTWAAEGSLADRLLMTDFSSFDELGHVTNQPCRATFSSSNSVSVNRTLKQGAPLSVCRCLPANLFFKEPFWSILGSEPFSPQYNLTKNYFQLATSNQAPKKASCARVPVWWHSTWPQHKEQSQAELGKWQEGG